jgi:hypothetical protein
VGPDWGCYTSSDADYVNQWKFGGSLLARFWEGLGGSLDTAASSLVYARRG